MVLDARNGDWVYRPCVYVLMPFFLFLSHLQEKAEGEGEGGRAEEKGARGDEDGDEDEDEESGDGRPRLSRKQRRRLNRLSVAELKQLVARPDVVEVRACVSWCGWCVVVQPDLTRMTTITTIHRRTT